MADDVPRGRSDVRLHENSTTLLIMPEFRDLMSRQAEIVVKIRSRERFRARHQSSRGAKRGRTPRSGAIEHPAVAPRVPLRKAYLQSM
jgi:hypothetical protein